MVLCASIVRYYDYGLFGLSASVLSKHLMPDGSSADKIVTFFGFFSLVMFVRPLGSIIFGEIGDKYGRIASLKVAVIMAAISTSLIAVIPNYDVSGSFSIVALILCRMLFLVSLAGEVDGIRIYISEKIDKKHRNFGMGLVSFSSQVGVLIASIMYYLSYNHDGGEYLWRANFLLGGIMGLLVFLMRGFMKESEIFTCNKSNKRSKYHHENIISIISRNKLKFLLSTIINGILGGVYYFLVIFFGLFICDILNITTISQSNFGNIAIIFFYSIACLISGFLADRFYVLIQIIIAIILSLVSVVILAISIKSGDSICNIQYFLAFLAPFYIIPCHIKIQSLFEINTRMRMCSLSHSIGSMVLSSTTPAICGIIWKWSQSMYLVLWYFVFQLLVLLVSILIIEFKNFSNYLEANNG